jgi:hypothetical protein
MMQLAASRTCLSVAGIIGFLGSASVAFGADGRLATTALQKSAVKCQQAIAQVNGKLLTGKLKALDACAGATLSCVQTKADKPDCLAKAGKTCVKKLSAAAAAVSTGQAKILKAKSCALELQLPDLLASDGLGLGLLRDQCQADFGLDICGGVDALAGCLVRVHDGASGALYGAIGPRTGELLEL